MRIVIATSGGGGHLFCGLSIAKALRERIPGVEIYFLGSKGDYKIYANRFLFSQIISIIQSGLLYLYIRPHIVLSTGGFASFGILFWSWLFHRPCIIHEQNLIPGKANRLAGHLADKILISFEDTQKYFKRNCIYTGMPVRFKERLSREVARKMLDLEENRFTILVMGGSKGAHGINNVIVDMLGSMPGDIQFIHLTGREDMDLVKAAYARHGMRAHVEDFSSRMDVIYSAADLVIGRAGSGSLSEITFFGLPSILMPYPYSRDRHQHKNADFMAGRGAALAVLEDSVSVDSIIELIESKAKLQEMAEKSKGLADPNAVEKIVDEILEAVNA